MPHESPVTPSVLSVDPGECPCRTDVYVADHFEELSRSRVQTLIREGRVRVDGAEVKPKHLLRGGERIEVEEIPSASPAPEPEEIPIDVLHEDDDLIVVNKPAGMVVHPGAGVNSGALVNALLARYGRLSNIGGPTRPGIVHRLDRGTSGCIAVARTDVAHNRLTKQLADRSMRRIYLAWVVGEMSGREGSIEAPIGRSMRNRTRMAVTRRSGRPALTHWEAVARAPGLTRLRCRLETGRTHQIRVHLAHVGHPVVGDPAYGLSAREMKMRIPPGHPDIIRALSRTARPLLHAHRLCLNHPASGEPMEFEAPLPEDFLAFDRALEPFTETIAPPHP
ncbi:MAG TPA: RluA family pseudouridine synthase [Sumerlaeia bacterium]|nr:RluA family pseudouridine synthase [Sumerlaeia bacterium]